MENTGGNGEIPIDLLAAKKNILPFDTMKNLLLCILLAIVATGAVGCTKNINLGENRESYQGSVQFH
ncbi:MAG: hypothetical protein LBV28_04900 [Puniceicoccales bacterium]|nr:hypothetical protein [Puniceicoccales bacterium]